MKELPAHRLLIRKINKVCTYLLVGSYVLLTPMIAMPLYSKMIFYPDYPSRYNPEDYKVDSLAGIAREELYIPTSHGKRLHCWFFRKPEAKYVVLLSHGNASNLSNRVVHALTLLGCGVSVLLYDYQGYGLSNGEPGLQNICDDGLAAYDYLNKKMNYQPNNIILYGESIGCAVSCYIASHRNCEGLILQSGFSSLPDIAEQTVVFLRAYPRFLFPQPQLDNVAALRKINKPVLIIHGQLDTLIRPSHAELLMRSAAGPKTIAMMPHSGHCIMPEDIEAYLKALQNFVLSLH